MPNLWHYRPSENITESISFLTDVISARNKEERRQARAYPRQTLQLSYLFKNDTDFSEAKFFAINNSHIEFDIPWWPEHVVLNENLQSADTSISYADMNIYLTFVTDIIVWGDNDYAVCENVTVTPSGIVLSAPIGKDILNPVVAPIRTVRALNGFSFTRNQGNINRCSIEVQLIGFTLITSQVWPIFGSYPIIDQPSETAGSLNEKISREIEVYDTELSGVSVTSTELYTRHFQVVEFKPFGIDERKKIKDFVLWSRGRLNAFYLPTWNNETSAPDKTLVRFDADRIELLYSGWDRFSVSIPVAEVNDE